MLIKAENLVKIYRRGSEEIRAVNDVSLEIKNGEFVSVIGPSGSGKTTLINILGCLDNPTSGKLIIDNKQIFGQGTLNETKLTRVRRELYGYIFQKFYLIPTLNVFENVMIPFTFYKKEDANPDVTGILKKLGIYERRFHLPNQLSGGEMQRVAIARALANKPKILLADEPTGSLDTKRSDEISAILKELNKEEKLTIILVTHNPDLSKMADRIIELRDGKIYF